MQQIIELVLRPEEAANENIWKSKAIRQSGVDATDAVAVLHRKSIDARSKQVKVKLAVKVYSAGELPVPETDPIRLQNVANAVPAIIIGCGPAGMFAALRLIEAGVKPIIIERGKDVKERRRDLADLNKKRIVNPDSNYCFGEGGAGTYSDGKLYTRSGKRGSITKILNTFIAFGASHDIAIEAHPHIGTNKLPGIIESMRNAIVECGGEIHFNHRFSSFILKNNAIEGVNCHATSSPNATISFSAKAVILATGHSARDIFEYLANNKITIASKPFALGVRIEHPQKIIDKAQYHCDDRGEFLPAASYSLTAQAHQRGVYSFCMCPGGIIAAASTAPGEIVVNGWSPSKRNNPFANSGIVVSVNDSDFSEFNGAGELRAMRYQQQVEQKTFVAGGKDMTAPAQRLMDFLEDKNSSTLPTCSYIPGIIAFPLKDLLPPPIILALKTGFTDFGNKMRGYLTNEAVLVATESRTSSPVKIPRDDETLMHPQITGFFPCGEGAGYAGGIMSAAMDGERVAEKCALFLQ